MNARASRPTKRVIVTQILLQTSLSGRGLTEKTHKSILGLEFSYGFQVFAFLPVTIKMQIVELEFCFNLHVISSRESDAFSLLKHCNI